MVQGVDLSNVLTRDDNLTNLQIQELEARGIRVDQKLNILEDNSQFGGQVKELDETDPRGTDAISLQRAQFFWKMISTVHIFMN